LEAQVRKQLQQLRKVGFGLFQEKPLLPRLASLALVLCDFGVEPRNHFASRRRLHRMLENDFFGRYLFVA
jgi:hypothetical protein